MQTTVIARIQIEGTHHFEYAPVEVAWLANQHHHTFHIAVYCPVSHSDRDVEIIMLGHRVEDYLHEKYGRPVCVFGRMSCEHIAAELLEVFDLYRCTVLEDGRHGAEVQV